MLSWRPNARPVCHEELPFPVLNFLGWVLILNIYKMSRAKFYGIILDEALLMALCITVVNFEILLVRELTLFAILNVGYWLRAFSKGNKGQ